MICIQNSTLVMPDHYVRNGTVLTDGNKITRGSVMTAQNNVQYAMDREDNELKQDMVSLNSYITKRDNSYSTASKLTKKYANSAYSTIRNFQ